MRTARRRPPRDPGAARAASGARQAGRAVRWPGAARRLLPALGLAAGLGGVAACQDPQPARATLSVTGILADQDTAGFARADRPRAFVFPDDHGPHPAFRHEWWYFTGNLVDGDGRRVGFQLTIFRSALRPPSGEGEAPDSPWATDQAYMAHFAVSDLEAGRFHAFERFDRGALGLAGAGTDPLRVHVGDWEVTLDDDAGRATTAGQTAFRVRAADGDVAIDLRLASEKPVVLQGEDGLSRKGPEPGNASYYYSLTRLATRGTVTIDGVERAVEGWAWLDREWGTSALGPDLEGWDWFAIQLDDRTELMFYQLRRQGGGMDPLSRGSFVHRDGRTTPIRADDVVLEPTGLWASVRGGEYPSGWRLTVPSLDLALRIEPALRDQELDLSFRYWEGAVEVDGRRGGAGVRGRGYVELTGYGDRDATSRGDSSGAVRPSTGRPSAISTR